jgi:hypothetical protein
MHAFSGPQVAVKPTTIKPAHNETGTGSVALGIGIGVYVALSDCCQVRLYLLRPWLADVQRGADGPDGWDAPCVKLVSERVSRLYLKRIRREYASGYAGTAADYSHEQLVAADQGDGWPGRDGGPDEALTEAHASRWPPALPGCPAPAATEPGRAPASYAWPIAA